MKSYIRPSGIANHQPEIVDVILKITGAKANNLAATAVSAIVGYDETEFTQLAVDALIGAGDIVAVTTAFGSTRMGTDSLGIVLNMEGQVRQLLAVEVIAQLATGVSIVASCPPAAAELADAAADIAEFALTPLGNVYGSIVVTGLDAAESGFIHLRIICRLK